MGGLPLRVIFIPDETPFTPVPPLPRPLWAFRAAASASTRRLPTAPRRGVNGSGNCCSCPRRRLRLHGSPAGRRVLGWAGPHPAPAGRRFRRLARRCPRCRCVSPSHSADTGCSAPYSMGRSSSVMPASTSTKLRPVCLVAYHPCQQRSGLCGQVAARFDPQFRAKNGATAHASRAIPGRSAFRPQPPPASSTASGPVSALRSASRAKAAVKSCASRMALPMWTCSPSAV